MIIIRRYCQKKTLEPKASGGGWFVLQCKRGQETAKMRQQFNKRQSSAVILALISWMFLI